MRPTDPAVRRQLAPARRPLTVVLVAGAIGSLLLVGQAWAVTELVLAALHDGAVGTWAAVVVAVFAARSLTGWTTDVMAARAAAVVGSDIRRRVVGAILRDGGAGRSTGELAGLATRGASAAEPYLTRYVPALVLAGVLPCVTLVAIATQDPMSALIVLVTLPLIPVFGILVGLATRDRAQLQWRALASLSGHFLDVMRGLPTLVAFRRAEAQSATIRSITDRYRRRTLHTLQLAFASSAVLELVATLSVALVAVTVGIRLAARRPRPRDGAGRPAARARGLLAAAPGRRGVPRGGRGGRDVRGRERARRCRRHDAAPADRVDAARPRVGAAARPYDACSRRRQPRPPRTRRHRHHGTVRLRQVDPARGPRRPARADVRAPSTGRPATRSPGCRSDRSS